MINHSILFGISENNALHSVPFSSRISDDAMYECDYGADTNFGTHIVVSHNSCSSTSRASA